MTASDRAFADREDAGIVYTLTRMEKLMEALGHPQNARPLIHAAGTNGKGSTVAFIDQLLQEGGKTTASFTTPSLGERHEQLTFNGVPVSKAIFDKAVELVLPAVQKTEAALGEKVSPFELLTAVVYTASAEILKPDVLIIEAGMGGRLDATNVAFKPAAVVLTSIGTDHAEYLGGTREAVAREKAGIMREGVRCISACGEEADAWLREEAEKTGAFFEPLAGDWSFAEPDMFIWKEESVRLPVPGEHQARNARAALAAVEELVQPKLSALARSSHPGRWEHFTEKVILDTAHNTEAVRELCRLAQTLTNVTFLTAVMRDKPVREMMNLMNQTGEVTVTAMPDARGMTEDEWYREFPELPFTARPAEWVTSQAERDGRTIIITGSHAFIRYMRSELIREQQ
ncbi:bifunctional folylpolyglutamate synthase/dihydrofolate synthase [Alkalicoccus halolimnae]|uniref:Mur ligase family protein n=1 Tax=Alkalicoccus halolimnae TaxID=1667239 RepID=A0AAJ8N1C7_9BACI|nr:Mur ligase family protein [Alkalicoccus halolimnae]